MFKIKLLISLLISLILFSCVNIDIQNDKHSNIKYSIGYIGGGYNGLVLKNLMTSHMTSIDLLDPNAKIEIIPSISTSKNVYITNIDNTSDREKIINNLNVKIIDKDQNCLLSEYNESASQYYIYASGEKFLSNKNAINRIEFENIENLIKDFIYDLKYMVLKKCINEK